MNETTAEGPARGPVAVSTATSTVPRGEQWDLPPPDTNQAYRFAVRFL